MSKPAAIDIVELGAGGPRIQSGTADPRAGAGITAPISSYYFRATGNPLTFDIFVKSGSADTAWIPLLSNGFTATFGDGSDGTVSVAGATNEANSVGDVYYENLTVQATGTYRPQGRRIYVRDTLQIDAGGVFTINGNTATTATGAAATTGYSTSGGTAGGTGATGAGANGSASTGTAIPAGVLTGIGGAAGAGTGGAGGAGGTNAGVSTTSGSARQPPQMHESRLATGVSNLIIAAGTGGGGGGGNGAAGAGGGGGGGAGIIIVFARRFINNGTMSANGGNGAPGQAVDTGGGGGGGGGRILILCRSFVGNTPTATGGNGGATGGGAGVAGSVGAAGSVFVFPM